MHRAAAFYAPDIRYYQVFPFVNGGLFARTATILQGWRSLGRQHRSADHILCLRETMADQLGQLRRSDGKTLNRIASSNSFRSLPYAAAYFARGAQSS